MKGVCTVVFCPCAASLPVVLSDAPECFVGSVGDLDDCCPCCARLPVLGTSRSVSWKGETGRSTASLRTFSFSGSKTKERRT